MTIFESASKPKAMFQDWDPRYPEVVGSLLSILVHLPVGIEIEHVGSTAVPGCGGKGIIDLLAIYPDGALDETNASLLSLGLSRQGPEFARAWPETRPMYLGWYRYFGEPFMVYVHVVPLVSDEVRRFRDFRNLLRDSPDLVVEYCNLKRQILSAGILDTDEYAVRKRPFMRRALGSRHALKAEDA